FFAGEFAKYGWAKLMAPNMGGFDVLALYSEAIGKMNENPGIPSLFRDIFKNAYLPYRDPETLRSFLKEINVFTYDHSEKLGDAFEYLLSVLGSQGDAGQFRTPRHIIDFMVELIDPQKGERILDPACGTAGFLISAWKHILKQNTSLPSPASGRGAGGEGAVRAGDLLTPAQRAYIAANVHGYDISPDMVRLSLVNLYLHGFSDPHIVEYDTLTSEEKWNDQADVILANPPFMSPKGGIKPHKRFSIQASRSEVLFVDYIAEHLSPNGRAAIIVPEGIIFQSGTAYKQLRQMLVKNSLVAVISLPAGVFNPYSGVKTSILILDKWLAKRSDDVLFIKVENDGFNLGAQRRAMAGSGLPDALAAYQAFRHSREGGNPVEFDAAQFGNANLVEKARIGENGEWNLSGERYRSVVVHKTEWPMVSMEEVCTIQRGLSYSSQELGDEENGIPLYNLKSIKRNGVAQNNDFKYFTGEIKDRHCVQSGDVLIALTDLTPTSELIGSPKLVVSELKAAYSADLGKLVFKGARLAPQFLYCLLRSDHYRNYILTYSHGANVKHLQADGFHNFLIPLPPLAIQQEIVAEIEGYQKIIDGARQVVAAYQPRINVQPDWPIIPLDETCDIQRGKFSHRPRNEPRFYGGKYPFIQTGDIVRADGGKIEHTQTLNDDGLSVSKLFQPPIVVITIAANIGDTAVLDFPSCFPDSVVGLIPKAEIDAHFLELIMRTQKQHLNNIAPQAAQKNINIEILKTIKIPIPPIETQRAIVAEIEAEQALVNANKQLINRFEAKIKTTINRVWGEKN
ncbi:MAG: N-6 DNA methylase, partial [Sideroxydans sp.]|nr:N-6 DNA methylase [Sideroxydans sp.]